MNWDDERSMLEKERKQNNFAEIYGDDKTMAYSQKNIFKAVEHLVGKLDKLESKLAGEVAAKVFVGTTTAV